MIIISCVRVIVKCFFLTVKKDPIQIVSDLFVYFFRAPNFTFSSTIAASTQSTPQALISVIGSWKMMIPTSVAETGSKEESTDARPVSRPVRP